MTLVLIGAVAALTWRVRQLMQAVTELQQQEVDRRLRYMGRHRTSAPHIVTPTEEVSA